MKNIIIYYTERLRKIGKKIGKIILKILDYHPRF